MSSSINREKFTLGISLLFKTQWTALKLAVDMQWGGHDSEDKRDWLIDVMVNYFDKSNIFIFNFQFNFYIYFDYNLIFVLFENIDGKDTDVDDLETILNQVMTDEFNTLLEDDSAYQVSINNIFSKQLFFFKKKIYIYFFRYLRT